MPEPTTTSHSPAVEDYIKQIYKLEGQKNKITTKSIAERLGLGSGTVSGMLKQLASKGLIEHQPYHGVHLTEAGKALAMHVIRRHRLIELFLVETLDYDWDEVDDDAEQLEHAVSDALIERIDAKLGYPEVDPHGAPIPDAHGKLPKQDYKSMSAMEAGNRGEIRRVENSGPDFLQYLTGMGISLGTKIQIVKVAEFGMVHIRVDDRDVYLATEAARRILVKPDSD